MNETTTLLKVTMTDLVLRMIEAGVPIKDMTLENPIRAIREISHDMTGRRKVRLANGREMSALEIQSEYHSRAAEFVDREGCGPEHRQMLELWGRVLKAVDTEDLSLIDREIDWATKFSLIERYRAKRDLPLSHPRIAQMDLAYHDISRTRGLYYLLERAGQVDRVAHEPRIFEAKNVPPQTTRARLRGEFIRKAQEKRRDFTVDWVHLKLNDQAQRTVLCKDPFKAVDERVDKLIASHVRAGLEVAERPHAAVRGDRSADLGVGLRGTGTREGGVPARRPRRPGSRRAPRDSPRPIVRSGTGERTSASSRPSVSTQTTGLRSG